jgi:pyruvate formate lyase activating enzyme
MKAVHLPVGGVVPFSTVDYPNHLAAVIFCQGCSWRCRYCHNAHLRPQLDGLMVWRWPRLSEFLKERVGFLDAVVFSGGEPTLHDDLGEAMRAVKSWGFKVGLHTAGIYPDRLAEVLPLVDWVGFDIKAPLGVKYDQITGRHRSAEAVKKSLAGLLASGVSHQLRTTVHHALLSRQDLAQISQQMEARGAMTPVWQQFRSEGCGSRELCRTAVEESAQVFSGLNA